MTEAIRSEPKDAEKVVPAAVATSFNWLSWDARVRWPSYGSYSQFSHRAISAFDFGADGYAGSCNYGGELLHLSAASENLGLIFARGDFSSSIYSSIARAQMEFGGPSTFGLKVSRNRVAYNSEDNKTQGSSFRLGEMLERGCFNYRWPLNEYALLLNEEKQNEAKPSMGKETNGGAKRGTEKPRKTNRNTEERAESERKPVPVKEDDKETGTCTMFSFFKDGICYQILRIRQGSGAEVDARYPFPDPNQIVLTIGGPILLRSLQTTREQDESPNKRSIENQSSADQVRFFDPRSNIGLEARIFQLHENYSREEYSSLELHQSTRVEDNGVITNKPSAPGSSKGAPGGPAPPCAYNAFVTLPCQKHPRCGQETATFIATIRLFEGSRNEKQKQWPAIPKSVDVYNYVGVSPWSRRATGVMWEDIFLGRRLRTGSVPETTEVSLIGRCLEKILQVDIFPKPSKCRNCLALVTNHFVLPTIQFRSLFWKVRFLTKVYNFLDPFRKEPGNKRPTQNTTGHGGIGGGYLDLSGSEDNEKRRVASNVEFQLDRIRTTIDNVVLFLVEVLLGNDSPSAAMLMARNTKDKSDNYYIMITIWYVIRNFPDRTWQFERSLKKLSFDEAESLFLQLDNLSFKAESPGKLPLLRWYHYGSVLSLIQRRYIPGDSRGLVENVYRLGKIAQIALAARLLSKSPYSDKDEIVDRLAFLAHELGLERIEADVDTMASLSIQRVKQRESTRHINPGWLSQHEEGYICSPWEIHALCHNSRLNALALEDYDPEDWRANTQRMEIESYKVKIYYFLNSEATLVSRWERSHLKARRGWLRSEATAVFGSTRLDIHKKVDGNRSPTPQHGTQLEGGKRDVIEEAWHIRAGLSNALEEAVHMRSLMSCGVDQLTNVGPRPIDWTTYAPPRQYHPDNFIRSLEDTPHHYRSPVTDKIAIPDAIRRYADPPDETGFDIHDIRKTLEEMPGSVSVSDIVAIGLGSPDDLPIHPDHHIVGSVEHTYYDRERVPGCLSKRLSNKEHEFSNCKGVSAGKEKLAQALFDSLVDQDVQHRFLIVREGIEKLIRLLVYVIHLESATSLSNHVLRTAQFSCQKGSTWIMGITLRSWRRAIHNADNIATAPQPSSSDTVSDSTVDRACSSWDGKKPPARKGAEVNLTKVTKGGSVRAETRASNDADNTTTTSTSSDAVAPTSFHPDLSPDDDIISIPAELRGTNHDYNGDEFHLVVSSIVLSTNTFGDFSKCTIISKSIKEDDLVKLIEASRKLWLRFIHQPQTARCLVFLLVLGMVCDALALEYGNAINRLSSAVDFRTVFLDEKDQWQRDHKSIDEFKVGLWSLDSLHKLHSSLTASIQSILKAREELMQQIKDGDDNRSEPLQRMCQEYVGVFESTLVKLTTVNVNLQRRIELHDRYKDALSAVLALRDSRTSLKQNDLSISQNDTIRMLTYLTIGYLPMGLIVAIFAIPGEQRVVFQQMGTGWFIGAIILMSVATYVVAAIIGCLSRKKNSPPTEKPNPWKLLKIYWDRRSQGSAVAKDPEGKNVTPGPRESKKSRSRRPPRGVDNSEPPEEEKALFPGDIV